MPFDGSGNFQRVMNWVADAAAAIKIRADRHDSEDDNFASGLSMCITKDGQTQPTANIPMNGKKITNLAAPTVNTDAVNKAYVDAIRTFSTTVTMSGNDGNGRIYFTGTGNLGLSFQEADLSFGVKATGNPAGSVDRFVWMPTFAFSGTPIMELKQDGRLNFGTNCIIQWQGADKFLLTETYGHLQAPSLYIQQQAGDTAAQVIFRDSGSVTRSRFGFNQASGRAIIDQRSSAGAIENSLELSPSGLYLDKGNFNLPGLIAFTGASAKLNLGGEDVFTLHPATGATAFYARLRVQGDAAATSVGVSLQDNAGNVRSFIQSDFANSRLALDYRSNAGALQQSMYLNASDGLVITQGANAGTVVTSGSLAALTNYQSTNSSNVSFPVTETILVQRTVNTPRCAVVNPCLSNASTGLYETLGAANAGSPLAGNWNARGRMTDFTYLARRTS